MKKFLLGMFVALFFAGLAPLVVLGGGFLNFGASAGYWPMEKPMAEFALSRSIGKRAPTIENPLGERPGAAKAGATEYFETCVLCHTLPGVAEAEFTGFNPSSPPFDTQITEKWSDGELFWIIKNGIRMTGMPAYGSDHSDEEIWEIVAFLHEATEAKPIVGESDE